MNAWVGVSLGEQVGMWISVRMELQSDTRRIPRGKCWRQMRLWRIEKLKNRRWQYSSWKGHGGGEGTSGLQEEASACSSSPV